MYVYRHKRGKQRKNAVHSVFVSFQFALLEPKSGLKST